MVSDIYNQTRVVRVKKEKKKALFQCKWRTLPQNKINLKKTRYKTLTVLLCSYSLFFCQVCVLSASYEYSIK